jgi:hypothetical protein
MDERPLELCDDEFRFYEDMFPYVRRAISGRPENGRGLAEGGGCLPLLLEAGGVSPGRYICAAPTRDFQLREYTKRPWIGQVLEGASDPGAAFANWMERDVRFSERVLREAKAAGYATLLVDGRLSAEQNMEFIEGVFGLSPRAGSV